MTKLMVGKIWSVKERKFKSKIFFSEGNSKSRKMVTFLCLKNIFLRPTFKMVEN